MIIVCITEKREIGGFRNYCYDCEYLEETRRGLSCALFGDELRYAPGPVDAAAYRSEACHAAEERCLEEEDYGEGY